MGCRVRRGAGARLLAGLRGCCHRWVWVQLLLSCLVVHTTTSHDPGFPGTISCYDDKMMVRLPGHLASRAWKASVTDFLGAETMNCTYTLDSKKLILIAAYENCTKMVDDIHQMNIELTVETSVGTQTLTYRISCPAIQADDPLTTGFLGATNCTKDLMSVSFPQIIPSFDDETMTKDSQMAWTLSVGDHLKPRILAIPEAMEQGYTFFIGHKEIIIQVSFSATGVNHFKQGTHHLYTAALKLTYGPPEQRLILSSQMICAPGPATCNSTHMTITIPKFPGWLTAISIGEKNIPMNQLHANGIAVDQRNGLRLYISKRALNSRDSDSCTGFPFYLSSLKLTFQYYGEMVSMVMYPECSCDPPALIDAVCTQDGYMDFEVHSHRTKPALNLSTLKVRDETCKPVLKSQTQEMVEFHIPLNGCGTSIKFEGNQAVYENEVHALWADLPPSKISRDSEFRLTVMCYYSDDDLIVGANITNPPPPVASVKQGPLSLILQIYPDDAYKQPYGEELFPIVKFLRQPIYLEVQVLNRSDPNIKLVLDDCWATMVQDPDSLPRWDIIVDGCAYQLDNYRTTFHKVGSSLNYPNHYQRFEVKTFAFVTGDKALSSLVYFHCSALLCDHLNPDSSLCSVKCPLLSRNKRAGDTSEKAKSTTTSLPGPVLLVSDEWSPARGTMDSKGQWNKGVWIAATTLAVIVAGIFVVASIYVTKCLRPCTV
ncbi:zona pellucida sperm-binding protein 2 [Tachyglossus aculeatus]|uniref:zona pellucida sperm-binding protein 2 n=1 Tax=Tachyglossus aculeatus TaxID=9261 RepID=UPI0018F3A942|nr:zona pellucida sperm-binding protein 2 [Tachyglossus aculeatus]